MIMIIMERHERAITEFSRLIDAAVRAKGWSHAVVGRELGVAQQSVTRWIHGQALPERERLEIMAEVLDIDHGELQEAWDGAALAKYGRPSQLARQAVDRALQVERESTKAETEDLRRRLAVLEEKLQDILRRFPLDS